MAPAATDLLDAVAADPDADGPRLAYAAWLAEAGQPERAEYVRLTVELERLAAGLSPRNGPARRRINELHRAHYKAWAAERPALDGVRWNLHRGLFEHAWFDSYTAFQK